MTLQSNNSYKKGDSSIYKTCMAFDFWFKLEREKNRTGDIVRRQDFALIIDRKITRIYFSNWV